jgi:hypothetical protein
VLRSDLSPDREQQATLRGLPFNTGGFVRDYHHGSIAEVGFLNGRYAFVREEDLRVLTTVEERLQRKEQSRLDREARRVVEQTGAYVTPETVEQAYAFGKMGAIHGRPHMQRGAFLATSTDHPHPNSLWRAYRRGHREGRAIRRERDGDRPDR